MKHHLTENEIIKYQFRLATDIQADQIAEHLKTCADCQMLAEQVKNKFAALDLLAGEQEVSQELITKTLAGAKNPKKPILLFKKPIWIAAVAAVLVTGSMLLIPEFAKDEKTTQQIVKNINESSNDMLVGADAPQPRTWARAESMATKTKALVSAAKQKAPATPVVVADDIVADVPEKPPFAPASAIELVVLPRRDNVQITIYNSADLTLVREKRSLTLKKEWNWLQFMWAGTMIDPTSLSLQPLQHAGQIDIQQLVFPAGLKDIGRWLIRSEVEGQVPFEITYLTSGLSWRAFYMGTLNSDETKMTLNGYVRVANRSGEDYENAQTRLIVGNVHQLDQIADLARRQYPYDRPELKFNISNSDVMLGAGVASDSRMLNAKDGMVRWQTFYEECESDSIRPKEIKKEGLSEYFLYTIQGKETIPDKWDKRLLSFDVNDIEVKSLYKYDEERWDKQAIRFLSFANDEDHNLGDTPIPSGNMRIYSQTRDNGNLSYVGGADIKYIPVDEDMELNLGSARFVSIDPVLEDFKTANFVFDKKGNISGYDEIRTWKIDITNTKRLPVDIEITRAFGTAYWSLEFDSNDVSYEKHDLDHARFKTEIAPQSKRTFKYTLTTYHGLREQDLIEMKKQN